MYICVLQCLKWLQCVQCANQQAMFFFHVLYMYVNVQNVYNMYIRTFQYSKCLQCVQCANQQFFVHVLYNVQCTVYMSIFKMCIFQHSKCLQCVQCANQQASHQRRSPDDSDIIISHKIPSLTNRFDS